MDDRIKQQAESYAEEYQRINNGDYSDFHFVAKVFEAGVRWAMAHPDSDYAWLIHNFIHAYTQGHFGEITLQEAIDKYFKLKTL